MFVFRSPQLNRLIRTTSRENVLLLFRHVALLFETLVLEGKFATYTHIWLKNNSISKLAHFQNPLKISLHLNGSNSTCHLIGVTLHISQR